MVAANAKATLLQYGTGDGEKGWKAKKHLLWQGMQLGS